jgi:hypothetical protein
VDEVKILYFLSSSLQSVVDISITGTHGDMGLASTFQEPHVSTIKAPTIINSQIPGDSMNKTLSVLTPFGSSNTNMLL